MSSPRSPSTPIRSAVHHLRRLSLPSPGGSFRCGSSSSKLNLHLIRETGPSERPDSSHLAEQLWEEFSSRSFVDEDTSHGDSEEYQDDELVPLSDSPSEDLIHEMKVVLDWLQEQDLIPSAVAAEMRGNEEVIVITYEGDLDMSLVPTRIPVAHRKEPGYVLHSSENVAGAGDMRPCRSCGEQHSDKAGRTGKIRLHCKSCRQDTAMNCHNRPKVIPGSSFGVEGSAGTGTMGMFLFGGGNTYALTNAHVVLGPNKIGYFRGSSALNSSTPPDIHRSRQTIRAFVRQYRAEFAKATKMKEDLQRQGSVHRLSCMRKILRHLYTAKEIWKRREICLIGNTDICTGFYAERDVKREGNRGRWRSCDWAIAPVSRANRRGPNEILIGNKIFKFGPAKKPVNGMTVVKCGRTTGVTFGKIYYPLLVNSNRGRQSEEWYIKRLRYDQVKKIMEPLGGIQCPDGRSIITDKFSFFGDSGSIILSYPDIRPVGIHWGGTGRESCFMPIDFILERIQAKTGLSLQCSNSS